MNPGEFSACVDLLGGPKSASLYLGIEKWTVKDYIHGRFPIPTDIADRITKLVDDGPKETLRRAPYSFNRARSTNRKPSP